MQLIGIFPPCPPTTASSFPFKMTHDPVQPSSMSHILIISDRYKHFLPAGIAVVLRPDVLVLAGVAGTARQVLLEGTGSSVGEVACHLVGGMEGRLEEGTAYR